MNKLLFNEKLYIEQIIKEHNKDNLDINLHQLIYLLVIYYYQQMNINDKDRLANEVNKQLELMDFEGYYYERYYKTINDIIKNVIKYDIQLKDIYIVPLYESEYNIIKSCGSRKHQKILATLYVIARWHNNNGWTPNKCKTPHIKKFANVSCTNKEFDLIIHDLIVNGYIIITHKASQSCYKIMNFEDDKNTNVKLQFTSFNNIGNIYIASQDNIHMICDSCGRLIKRTSPRQKYCQMCANNFHKEQNKIYYEKKKKH